VLIPELKSEKGKRKQKEQKKERMNTEMERKTTKTKQRFSRKQGGRLNMKGDITLFIVLFGVFIAGGVLLLKLNNLSENVGDMGETTIKIINTFESTERLFFYMDTSVGIAAKRAELQTMRGSGYMQETFKGKLQNQGCGTIVYPVIDSKRGIGECFPDYEKTFKIIFTRELNRLLLKYDPYDIKTDGLETVIAKDNSGMKVWVRSVSDMNLPIFAYIESFYRAADKTRTANNDINKMTADENGYLTARKFLLLSSFPREPEDAPTTIVVHDTGTESVDETYQELQTGLKNYNYVIDKDGKVYKFASEDRRVRNADCTKAESKTCLVEGVDRHSVSIALQNTAPHAHLEKQVASLEKLIAEIASRNRDIELGGGSVLFDSEVDSSRQDPSADLTRRKDEIIAEAEKLVGAAPNSQAGNPSSTGTPAGSPSTPTGRATSIPSDVDLSKCFHNIRTTVYYTPLYTDIGVWSSGTTCGTSLECCKKTNPTFYDIVRCNGVGNYNEVLYTYDSISPTGPSASKPLQGYKNGKTKMTTDAARGRTVAAKCDSRFKLGTKLYIYWGADSSRNGYYMVEDTGSALDCGHIDIYSGVGNAEKNEFQSQIKDYGTVCILDSNFQMPDPDFSDTSTFVDPESGTYSARYNHQIKVENMTVLFDRTKAFFDRAIAACGDKASEAEKDACINEQMAPEKDTMIKVTGCDKDVKDDITSLADYAARINSPLAPDKSGVLLATITNVKPRAEGIRITPQNEEYSPEQALGSFLSDPDATITITDDSGGVIDVKIIGGASPWVDYENTGSELYKTNMLLNKDDLVLLRVKYDEETKSVYADTFSDASPNPDEVAYQEQIKAARQLADCATAGNACLCTLSPARVLRTLRISNETILNPDSGETGESIATQFRIAESAPYLTVDMTKTNVFTVQNNLIIQAAGSGLTSCVPKQTHRFICTSLIGGESLGTLKYALKI
jgi:3D (Asp-Asp-Asp) domain-containing protein